MKVPDGWLFIDKKRIAVGDYIYNDYSGLIWKLEAGPYSGSGASNIVIKIPELPKGYKAIAYRRPIPGDLYLYQGNVLKCGHEISDISFILTFVPPCSIQYFDYTGEFRHPTNNEYYEYSGYATMACSSTYGNHYILKKKLYLSGPLVIVKSNNLAVFDGNWKLKER